MRVANSKRSLIGGIISLILIVFSGLFIWNNQQAITDWWRLKDYDPPPHIEALADATAMSDRARNIFYVYHPRLEPASSFNEHCRIGNEFTIVLGCYVSGQGIYIFSVEDERLSGIEEVTAAHEMLHAAYERLSDEERRAVDSLTAAYFETNGSEQLRATVAEYRQDDPKSVPAELYAILGTEVRTLPAELEAHYSEYFSDRTKVVSLAEAYENAFADRKAKIDGIVAELTNLKEDIERRTTMLDAESSALAGEYSRVNQIRSSSDAQSYRVAAEAYNARVSRYNTAAAEVSRLIDSYNTLLSTYQSLVVEQQGLFDAIDSRPKELNTR